MKTVLDKHMLCKVDGIGYALAIPDAKRRLFYNASLADVYICKHAPIAIMKVKAQGNEVYDFDDDDAVITMSGEEMQERFDNRLHYAGLE